MKALAALAALTALAFAVGGPTPCVAFELRTKVSIGRGVSILLPPPQLRLSAAAGSNDNALGAGAPSNPRWESGRLNRLTEWAGSSTPNRPIIEEYDPRGRWLWPKWNGTVLKATWRSVLLAILTGLCLDFVARGRTLSNYSLSLAAPAASDPLIERLSAIGKVWEYQLTLTTFMLTFFLSQAFAYWQKIYNTTRMIQGRINDFCMLLAMGAERGSERKSLSARADEFVRTCTRLIRLSHTFFWAQTVTSSNGLNDSKEYLRDASNCTVPIDGDHIGPLLLSPYGLGALADAGQITTEEVEGLTDSGLPPSQYAYVLLVWAGIKVVEGLRDGTLGGGPGFEENVMRQLATLRACFFDIDDFRAGRMPLAYVQLVQVLVDSLVAVAPFALYPAVGVLSAPLAGLLALFFRGLFALSKSFLDPFGAEGYGEQCIRVDVLVSEVNFGAATRWVSAAGSVPYH